MAHSHKKEKKKDKERERERDRERREDRDRSRDESERSSSKKSKDKERERERERERKSESDKGDVKVSFFLGVCCAVEVGKSIFGLMAMVTLPLTLLKKKKEKKLDPSYCHYRHLTSKIRVLSKQHSGKKYY